MDNIKVKIIATGAIEEIRSDAFDEKLHEKVDERFEVVNLDALRELIQSGRDAQAQAISEGIATALQEAGVGTPQRSPAHAPGPQGDRNDDAIPEETREFVAAALSGARVTPGWEALYSSVPESERKYRTPENDVMAQRFFRALVHKDQATLDQVTMWDPGRSMEEKRAALGQGSGAIGGFLVPTPLSNLLVERLQKTEAIGPRAMQFTSPNTSIQVPVEGATIMAAAGVAENATAGETDPVFTQVTLNKKKAVAATRSSMELLSDSPFNLVTILSRQAGNAFATYNDAQDATDGDGTGTNQTLSLEDSAIVVEDASVGALAYSDVTALFYGLLAQYRRNAVWLCANAVIEVLAELLDSNGRPIFAPASAAATPIDGGQGAPGVGTILGRPVVEAPMSSGLLMIGDLSYYGVLLDGAIRVEASDQVAFLDDQVVYKFVQRRDGSVLHVEAFRESATITV